jgi:hypothetical protein
MECRLIDIPHFESTSGYIGFVQNGSGIPFEIKRVYFITNVPAGEVRGVHGHKRLEQVFIAINGSFKVSVLNSSGYQYFDLSNPQKGLYIPSMSWREITNFSSLATTCLVLASEIYEPSDYLYNKAEFITQINS